MIRSNAEVAQEKLWNTWNDWTTSEEGDNQEAENAEVNEKVGRNRSLTSLPDNCTVGLTHSHFVVCISNVQKYVM